MFEDASTNPGRHLHTYLKIIKIKSKNIPFLSILADGVLGTVVEVLVQALIHGFHAFSPGQSVEGLGYVGKSGPTPASECLFGVHANRIHIAINAVLTRVAALVDPAATDSTGKTVRGNVGEPTSALASVAFGLKGSFVFQEEPSNLVDTLGIS